MHPRYSINGAKKTEHASSKLTTIDKLNGCFSRFFLKYEFSNLPSSTVGPVTFSQNTLSLWLVWSVPPLLPWLATLNSAKSSAPRKMQFIQARSSFSTVSDTRSSDPSHNIDRPDLGFLVDKHLDGTVCICTCTYYIVLLNRPRITLHK